LKSVAGAPFSKAEAIEAVLSHNRGSAAYDPLGHEYQSGQDLCPQTGWDVSFEFSDHGIPPQNAADFSDSSASCSATRWREGHRRHPVPFTYNPYLVTSD